MHTFLCTNSLICRQSCNRQIIDSLRTIFRMHQVFISATKCFIIFGFSGNWSKFIIHLCFCCSGSPPFAIHTHTWDSMMCGQCWRQKKTNKFTWCINFSYNVLVWKHNFLIARFTPILNISHTHTINCSMGQHGVWSILGVKFTSNLRVFTRPLSWVSLVTCYNVLAWKHS